MNNLLKQQIDYYQDRAPEYDEWFYRLGRYDRGEALKQRWFEEVAILEKVLARAGHPGSILEVACGTGIWTKPLASICNQLLALDASEAMIGINKRRNEAAQQKIRYELSDFYEWTSQEKFQFVFTSFFISHVPQDKLLAVAEKLHALCAPGGELLIFDSLPDQTSSATDHQFRTDGVQERKLNNGKSYQVIKMFYQKEEVLEALKVFDSVEYGTTGCYFWYARCRRG